MISQKHGYVIEDTFCYVKFVRVNYFYFKFRVNLTGGSMNPARSFGPALAFSVYNGWIDKYHIRYDGWEYHYIYWVGPIAGALVAALTYRYIL